MQERERSKIDLLKSNSMPEELKSERVVERLSHGDHKALLTFQTQQRSSGLSKLVVSILSVV
jgi:hypothetical protein